MTGVISAAGSLAAPAVADGVDLDAVAAAARNCAAVDDLCPGPWQVAGVRVASDHVLISVRGRWGIPVSDLADQVHAAVRHLVGPRRIDIVVADLTEPAAEAPDDSGLLAAAPHDDEVSPWTSSPGADWPGGSSSAPITPTTAAIPPLSWSV